MIRMGVMMAALLALSACAQTAKEIGRAPYMSEVGSGVGEYAMRTKDFPDRPATPLSRFSTWNDRQSDLFSDSRALSEGDILTVLIAINDRAKLQNETDRSRTASKSIGAAGQYNILGTEKAVDGDADIASQTDFEGSGGTVRAETIRLSVAAVIVEVLASGNLVIRGSQEVRVNNELRILNVAGVVRPSDIEGNNTISYERIAEARISYGGRGRISEVQQPPYGQQILDLILPF